ncbi:hypothetical protein SAY86_023645 [Trapa natans]|uniref:Uncharacterized protein n=1 Tax=Trapa natans TaxID=22666 RepID=A0AAN7MB22_TRANT|nr:hypothetical protein SAY86_023645 [Trapa natans]
MVSLKAAAYRGGWCLFLPVTISQDSRKHKLNGSHLILNPPSTLFSTRLMELWLRSNLGSYKSGLFCLPTLASKWYILLSVISERTSPLLQINPEVFETLAWICEGAV